MSMNPAPSENGQRACPRCGDAFTCDLSAGSEKCWCFDRPRVITAKNSTREGCLCPTCLNKLIDSISHQQEASV